MTQAFFVSEQIFPIIACVTPIQPPVLFDTNHLEGKIFRD